MGRRSQEAFAIVRVDNFHDEGVSIENRVTVKCIVWSLAEAHQEVDRLNRLNSAKNCHYFWQTTRVLPGPEPEPT